MTVTSRTKASVDICRGESMLLVRRTAKKHCNAYNSAEKEKMVT